MNREYEKKIFEGLKPYMEKELPEIYKKHPEIKDIDPLLLGKLIQLGAVFALVQLRELQDGE